MAIKTYGYNDNVKLTEHFKSNEWRCKDGKKHEIKIDSELPILLEKVRTKLNASAGNIYSGYRCPEHNKNVGGGTSTNYSHSGYAVDMYFLDQNRNRINGGIVACCLEDMGHNGGISICCGGSSLESGNVHIDTKPRKWYGNEAISNSKSISTEKAISDGKTGHTNFLTYCFKSTTYYVNATSGLNIRNDSSTNGKILGSYKFGEEIKVYYIFNGWAKVGVTKWVSANYIQKDKPNKIDIIGDEEVEEAVNDKEIDELINEIIEKSDTPKKENDKEFVVKKVVKPSFWQRLIEFIKKIFKK